MKKCLVIISLFSFSFTSSEFVDGVVAKVANNTIIYSDVLQTIQIQAMQMGLDLSQNPSFVEENHDQALDFLINQLVIFEIAKKDTLIEVSGDEISSTIDSEIDLMTQRAGSKFALEEILDQSIQEYKTGLWDDVEKRLLVERYQQNFMAKINITRPEVESFYQEYKDSIPKLPLRSQFSIIEIPIEPSKESENRTINLLSSIRDSIILSDNFIEFAKKYSQDPGSKDNGGDLGYILRGSLVKEFEEVAFSLNTNEISTPVKTGFGFHLIQTLDKQGEKIHARHILLQIQPTDTDKLNTEKKLQDIYQQSKNNSGYFDSLAYQYQSNYENQSGVFDLIPDETIPPKIQKILQAFSGKKELLYPEESGNNSYYLVFVKDRKTTEKANLKNSWVLMEAMAKNNKITKEFDLWIIREKKHVFIQSF